MKFSILLMCVVVAGVYFSLFDVTKSDASVTRYRSSGGSCAGNGAVHGRSHTGRTRHHHHVRTRGAGCRDGICFQ